MHIMTESFFVTIVSLTFAGGLGIGILIGWLEWGRRLSRRRSTISSISS